MNLTPFWLLASGFWILLVPARSQENSEIEKKVKDLVQRLADDSIDERDRAQSELVKLGKAAEKALKAELATADGETRSRIEGVLKDLERRERLKGVLNDATRITLKKEAPARELLDDLRRLTATKITGGPSEGDDRPISVQLENAPLFQALDEICRLHGGLRFDVQTYGPAPVISVRRQKYVSYPRVFQDQFALWAKEVVLTRTVDLSRGDETGTTEVRFHFAWEAGTKPMSAKLNVTAVEDDLGKSYLDVVKKDERGFTRRNYLPNQLTVELTALPQEGARKLARVKGSIVFLFPQDIDALRIPAASLAKDATVKGQTLEIKVIETSRSGAEYKIKLSIKRNGDESEPEYKLVGKGGKELSLRSSSSTLRQGETTLEMTFEAGQTEIQELRITVQLGSREIAVPFDFKDVPIR